ncbi:hypothetical protein TB2_014960 [Malus domestica]
MEWKGGQLALNSTNEQGHSKSEFVMMMDFEVMGEDELYIEKAFDLILELAVNENLQPDQMVKKVFVFSKQQFSHEAYSYGKMITATPITTKPFPTKWGRLYES